ncbi:MAG TPA: transposase [Thermoleophilaceae bacterium]|nr:transposase [Thermoleophilaceae bacterium]
MARTPRSPGGATKRPRRLAGWPLDPPRRSSWRPNATYRKFTAQQKLEIVLAGLRGDRSVKDVCREHEIADALYYSWRDKLIEGGREQLSGKEERQSERELRRRVRELERALGRKTDELEIAGEALRGWK